MNEQKSAIYLTCTKNRSFQKKHIDVCKKCPSNDGCKEFQSYEQLKPIPKPAEIPLADIIKQLTDIRKLVGGGKSKALHNNPADAGFLAIESIPQYLKTELEGIKSLC